MSRNAPSQGDPQSLSAFPANGFTDRMARRPLGTDRDISQASFARIMTL
jgi:hypothetical protein